MSSPLKIKGTFGHRWK